MWLNGAAKCKKCWENYYKFATGLHLLVNTGLLALLHFSGMYMSRLATIKCFFFVKDDLTWRIFVIAVWLMFLNQLICLTLYAHLQFSSDDKTTEITLLLCSPAGFI